MNKIGLMLLGLAVLFCLTACSRDRAVVVLLPQPDGSTGKLVVSNLGGSQMLQEPNQATAIQSAKSAPKEPEILDEQKIQDIFGNTIKALPPAPIHFILYFKTGTTELSGDSRKLLGKILPAIVDHGSTDVSVVGHTDRVGPRKYNFHLGMERAILVQKFLLALGIDPRFFEVTSHGEDNPLIPTEDEVREPKNRRVEVVVR
ncbi:MAG: OmpA family protein [Deltaproteobacteria bacterium]|nr:OmpA family protein [Deltaproteobacteria bacterium]TLN03945.1 MAG: OmpA family protein [bacterium]